MAEHDTLRLYDDAVRSWVSSFLVEGQAIDTTFASPDRPYGKFNNEEGLRVALMKNPVVSITRLDLVYDPRHRIDGPWYPVAQLEGRRPIVVSQYPRPYRIPYQLDLRSRRRTVANLWLRWIYFKFNPFHVFKIDFHQPWGMKKIHAELQGRLVDNSDLEPGEKERWIRHTCTFEMIGFMFPSVDDLRTDLPDATGMLSTIPDVRHVQIDTYAINAQSAQNPNNELLDSQRRDVVEADVNLNVESQ